MLGESAHHGPAVASYAADGGSLGVARSRIRFCAGHGETESLVDAFGREAGEPAAVAEGIRSVISAWTSVARRKARRVPVTSNKRRTLALSGPASTRLAPAATDHDC